jgi:hypothetical protein
MANLGRPGRFIGRGCRWTNHLPIGAPHWLGGQGMATKLGFYESHRKGAHAESVALAWLLSEGYFVFTNFAGRGPVDLVAIDSGTPNVILIDVKAAVYYALTRRRPRLSELQKRLGVRLLVVDLDKGVCEFEETEFAEEDADPEAHGYLEY